MLICYHFDSWLNKQFREADKNNNKSLSFDEVITLLNHMNILMNEKHAKALFNVSLFSMN